MPSRMSMLGVGVIVAGLSCLFMPSCGLAEDPLIALTLVEKRSNWFSETQAHYTAIIQSDTPRTVELAWRLSSHERTILAGAQTVRLDAGQPQSVKIDIPLPPVAKEVIFPTELVVTAASTEDVAQPPATTTHKLWIFDPNPFSALKTTIDHWNIALYDPANTTSSVLDESGIPFKAITQWASLETDRPGMLLIGEGVSFDEEPGLLPLMLRLAATGVPVICLAPAAGAFDLPGTEAGDAPLPESLCFEGPKIIQLFDERLDQNEWSSDAHSAMAFVRLVPYGASVQGQIEKRAPGWPWMELRYGNRSASCIICGLGIMRDWATSPSPRYLLLSMIKTMKAGKDKTE